MIPFVHSEIINIGPLVIHTWGLFVSAGIVVALFVARARAKKIGLHEGVITDSAFWILIGGVIGARLGHVFFYDWQYFATHAIEIVKFWNGGMSSFGAFLGGAVAFCSYALLKKISIVPYLDALMFALPLGWGIGRIGCALIHDHVGVLSSSWLAVRFPLGSRLDMGLLESLFSFVLFGVVVGVARRVRARGALSVLVMTTYAVARFIMDFFRAQDIFGADARYFGLTPAQYGSIGLVSLCFFWSWVIIKEKHE